MGLFQRIPRNVTLLVLLCLVMVSAFALLAWDTWLKSRGIAQYENHVVSLPLAELSSEQARQDAIAQWIQNENSRRISSTLVNVLGPTIAVIVGFLGIFISVGDFVATRSKERQDRISTEFNSIHDRLASDEPRKRNVGVVGLYHFFSPRYPEQHLPALLVLLSTLRDEDDKSPPPATLRGTLRIAVGTLPLSILQQGDWRNMNLQSADLSSADFQNINFEGTNFTGADLTGCNLAFTDLSKTILVGAKLRNANLQGANLLDSDLTGADFTNANLANSAFRPIRVANLNLEETNLTTAKYNWKKFEWDQILNWRKAKINPRIRELLHDLYPERDIYRVLMLMWEIPPFVHGGMWTACYHLIRRLKETGNQVDVTVVVPWEYDLIETSPFEVSVNLIALNISKRSRYTTIYENSSLWGRSPSLSAYSSEDLDFLLNEFERGLIAIAGNQTQYNLIHAQEYMTFDAARKLARHLDKPWIAHLHSIQSERISASHATDLASLRISHLERRGVLFADHVIVPSHVTAKQIEGQYHIEKSQITVVPNVLSQSVQVSRVGSFNRKRVVFVGRLTYQKGPDRFAKIAQLAKEQMTLQETEFWMYGTGDMFKELHKYNEVKLMGELNWKERGKAFAGASAVLVTSRSEPFGMVVLEAMQYGVPVLYPRDSGAAEILKGGVQIRPERFNEVLSELERILGSQTIWNEIVEGQIAEILAYIQNQDATSIFKCWLNISKEFQHEDH